MRSIVYFITRTDKNSKYKIQTNLILGISIFGYVIQKISKTPV